MTTPPLKEGPSAIATHRVPAIPATIDSPLGVDGGEPSLLESAAPGAAEGFVGENDTTPPGGAHNPNAAVAPAAPAPAQPPITAPGPVPQPDSQTEEKAAAYDYLMNDPQFSEMVNTSVAARLGETPRPATPTPAPVTAPANTPPPGVSQEQYNGLVQQVQKLTMENANAKLADFKIQNPDFESHKQVTGQILQTNPNLTLPQAYHLAVMQNGGTPAPGRLAAVPPGESGPGGGGVRSSGVTDPMQLAAEKINALPQNPNRLEDAIKIAFQGAMEKHSSES